jgi:hypothetical protein
MPKIKFRRFRMLTRILAAAAFATLTAAAAQAGTLQNGTWTPNGCKEPGEAPMPSDKSAEAYNKSAKAMQAWQNAAQAYNECMKTEIKADQDAIINTANASLSRLNDQAKALNAANEAAIAKLKGKKS